VIVQSCAGITLTIFTFLGNYRSLMWQLIMIKDAHLRTVPIGLLSFQGQYGAQVELLMSTTLIGLVPLILLFIILSETACRGHQPVGRRQGIILIRA